MRSTEREEFAASIKGLPLDEYREQKKYTKTKDSADEFAAWHERFLHEITSEFGPLPISFNDVEDDEALEDYIKDMKKNFRLRLK